MIILVELLDLIIHIATLGYASFALYKKLSAVSNKIAASLVFLAMLVLGVFSWITTSEALFKFIASPSTQQSVSTKPPTPSTRPAGATWYIIKSQDGAALKSEQKSKEASYIIQIICGKPLDKPLETLGFTINVDLNSKRQFSITRARFFRGSDETQSRYAKALLTAIFIEFFTDAGGDGTKVDWSRNIPSLFDINGLFLTDTIHLFTSYQTMPRDKDMRVYQDIAELDFSGINSQKNEFFYYCQFPPGAFTK